MKRILDRILTEPVLAWQLVAAGIALAGSFGLELSAEQTAAVFGVFQVLAALAGRQLVIPMRKVRRLIDKPRAAQLDPRPFGQEKRR